MDARKLTNFQTFNTGLHNTSSLLNAHSINQFNVCSTYLNKGFILNRSKLRIKSYIYFLQFSIFFLPYRHEGRKMKQELRCHAVLCPSENKARLMAKRLKERLHQALVDFKKEKVWRQNARLSLANAADEQKTMPFRKIMLQPGSSNYRPPLEKGKSAPKLKVIEEVIFEEDEEEEMSEESESDPDDPTHTPLEMVSQNLRKMFKKS